MEPAAVDSAIADRDSARSFHAQCACHRSIAAQQPGIHPDAWTFRFSQVTVERRVGPVTDERQGGLQTTVLGFGKAPRKSPHWMVMQSPTRQPDEAAAGFPSVSRTHGGPVATAVQAAAAAVETEHGIARQRCTCSERSGSSRSTDERSPRMRCWSTRAFFTCGLVVAVVRSWRRTGHIHPEGHGGMEPAFPVSSKPSLNGIGLSLAEVATSQSLHSS